MTTANMVKTPNTVSKANTRMLVEAGLAIAIAYVLHCGALSNAARRIGKCS